MVQTKEANALRASLKHQSFVACAERIRICKFATEFKRIVILIKIDGDGYVHDAKKSVAEEAVQIITCPAQYAQAVQHQRESKLAWS